MPGFQRHEITSGPAGIVSPGRNRRLCTATRRTDGLPHAVAI